MRPRIEQYERDVDDLRSLARSLQEEVDDLRRARSEPAQWLDRVTARQILVHLKTDQTIEGLLTANLADGLVLRTAKLLAAGGGSTDMAGEVFIPRDNVLLVQYDR